MSAPGCEPARVIAWARVAGWCVVGILPTTVATVRGADDLSIPVMVTTIVLGAGVCLGLDDAAEATVAAVPTPRWLRRATRLAHVALALVVAAVLTAMVAAVGGGEVLPDLGHLVALAATTSAAALAITCRLPSDGGHRTIGGAGSAGALLGVLAVAMLSLRLTWLPTPGDVGSTGRWWLLAAVLGLAALPTFDDPARRPYRYDHGPTSRRPRQQTTRTGDRNPVEAP
ncbi:MAG: hypothetical protein MUF83_19705 [Acidimicrobiales bacterium]|jgi:hypothetical protein|nr:hypothetical protein [Acidimicrobiales bacterium]